MPPAPTSSIFLADAESELSQVWSLFRTLSDSTIFIPSLCSIAGGKEQEAGGNRWPDALQYTHVTYRAVHHNKAHPPNL